MFLRYYELREQPFGMTPDPRFLYLSSSHREALASLIYGIESGRGFVSLIAEPGMGKTTVLFQLMERLRNSARTVFLFQTQGDTREFLSNLIADLGLEPDDRDISSLQRQLNEVLIQEAQMGRQFVLVIDEAQNLDDRVLESVRMLSNFETSRTKLMQIVLAGQPGLAEKLARPELEQLRQRVSILCRLAPFTEDEVADYIQHRLEIAGYKGRQLFTPEALSMIADRSEGIPRNINNVCFHALSLAYAEGQQGITGSIVVEVLSDLKLDSLNHGRINPGARPAESPNKTPGLEGMTLGRRGQEDEARVPLRGGRQTRSSYRRAGQMGRRRRANPHWIFWAVTLLILVMGGEIFWAYLPSAAQRHAFAQLDAAFARVKGFAANQNPFGTKGSTSSSDMQTTVIHHNAGDLIQGQGVDPSESERVATLAPEQPKSPKPNEQKVAANAEDTTASSATAHPIPVRGKSSSNGTDRSSDDDFSPSAVVAEGTIVIESNVAGSAITIDGRAESGWQTPHIFTLPQGTYRISVSQPGYSTWFRDVRVTPGNKRWIRADLHPPKGVIVIDTDPPGMQVFIDGKAYGPSEVETALAVGLHTYKVIPPGGEHPLQGTFVLKPGDILTRKIRWFGSTAGPSAQDRTVVKSPKSKGNSSKGRERS